MPKLHLICGMGHADQGPDQGRSSQQQSRIHRGRRLGPSSRLSARRRGSWPEHLDAAPFHCRLVPGDAVADAAVRPDELCRAVFQALSVLGLRRGLPGLHGPAETAGEFARRVFAVAVPRAQRREQEAGQAAI